MVEKTVPICDVCKKSIAKDKCQFCDKDVCSECSDEIEVGTIFLDTCVQCGDKIENVIEREENFWKEFNKNEHMVSKIITHIKKKMILKNLDSDEDEDDERQGYPITTKRMRIKRKRRTGSWAEAMRGKTI